MVFHCASSLDHTTTVMQWLRVFFRCAFRKKNPNSFVARVRTYWPPVDAACMLIRSEDKKYIEGPTLF